MGFSGWGDGDDDGELQWVFTCPRCASLFVAMSQEGLSERTHAHRCVAQLPSTLEEEIGAWTCAVNDGGS